MILITWLFLLYDDDDGGKLTNTKNLQKLDNQQKYKSRDSLEYCKALVVPLIYLHSRHQKMLINKLYICANIQIGDF